MTSADTAAINAHLSEISRTVAEGAHAVLFLFGAGWHGSKAPRVPDSTTLIPLLARQAGFDLLQKVYGPAFAPTASPFPPCKSMTRPSDDAATPGTSSPTTSTPPDPLPEETAQKRSRARAVGIIPFPADRFGRGGVTRLRRRVQTGFPKPVFLRCPSVPSQSAGFRIRSGPSFCNSALPRRVIGETSEAACCARLRRPCRCRSPRSPGPDCPRSPRQR